MDLYLDNLKQVMGPFLAGYTVSGVKRDGQWTVSLHPLGGGKPILWTPQDLGQPSPN